VLLTKLVYMYDCLFLSDLQSSSADKSRPCRLPRIPISVQSIALDSEAVRLVPAPTPAATCHACHACVT
jgi:hypothetical protein